MVTSAMELDLTFDRTSDISKLDGCNTRGIEYRWDIFNRRLKQLPEGSNALDFGAGSLRESFEFAARGFHVTSVDIDQQVLDAYKALYVWPDGSVHKVIADTDFLSALSKLNGEKFSVITCFDVLEHLENPSPVVSSLTENLSDNGLLFISVPNGRTLFEIAWQIDLKLARATGRYIRPGEPHLQRNSPARWRSILQNSGLSIVDHELHIGFFANNSAALIQVPLALSGRIMRKIGINFDGVSLAKRIIDVTAPIMDFLDRRTPFLRGLYGWNLFVCTKAI